MKKFLFGLFTLTAAPFMAQAAALNTLGDVLVVFTNIINALMPFIVALAVLFFMWGVFQFVKSAGNEDERTEGRNRMIYGIIGIFVMVSVWGFVNLLDNTFRLDSDYIPCLPTFAPSC